MKQAQGEMVMYRAGCAILLVAVIACAVIAWDSTHVVWDLKHDVRVLKNQMGEVQGRTMTNIGGYLSITGTGGQAVNAALEDLDARLTKITGQLQGKDVGIEQKADNIWVARCGTWSMGFRSRDMALAAMKRCRDKLPLTTPEGYVIR